MDWDDGKEFGELRWRTSRGIFDREHYPIDHVEQLKALRGFLGGLRPGTLAPCGTKEARVACVGEGGVRVWALCSREEPDAVYGWLFSPGAEARFSLTGLSPGTYRVAWYDPWTGAVVLAEQSGRLAVAGGLELDAARALARLRAQAPSFPDQSRLDRGHDVAFKLQRQGD